MRYVLDAVFAKNPIRASAPRMSYAIWSHRIFIFVSLSSAIHYLDLKALMPIGEVCPGSDLKTPVAPTTSGQVPVAQSLNKFQKAWKLGVAYDGPEY
ncbi:MAG: hypothetical protein JRM77_09525 [Nitrososphaerota archaeon]|jgi:hypothetical protein|nr:hypothetical protein [Nitrososphaerota archaeon]